MNKEQFEALLKEEIVHLRKRLGLTQKGLAAQLKVDAITVSRWERGEQKPSRQAEKQFTRLLKRSKGD